MIQFNLLPEVKAQYVKVQKLKRLVIGISLVLSGVALFVFVVLIISVYVVQKRSINDLDSQIQTRSSSLKNTPNLSTILTVQSQLNTLSSLDTQSPAASRIFNYLYQLVPTQATISDLQVDFTQNTMTIIGNAVSLSVVNAFVDNLKYTSYTTNLESSSQNAFSSVVLSSFGITSGSAAYSITLNFDPAIFSNTDTVTLSVGGNPPSTASQQPSIIFQKGS